jgi:8-oxo-dGTP diphosphatase
MRIDRVVSVYVLNNSNQVLLLKHAKFNSWLPPGGHVEENELTHQAALREVLEESGIEIEFIYDSFENLVIPKHESTTKQHSHQLPTPLFIQLEDIGDHYHEDVIYLAKAITEKIITEESREIHWFNFEEAEQLDIFDNVRLHLNWIKQFCV